MAIVKAKPTSPGRRGVVSVKHDHIWKGRPLESLTESKKSNGGRNNVGRLTTRHQGGGHKQRYRVVDFKRDKDGIRGSVERIEYDPNRSAHIALIKFADGERRYILAPRELRAGDEVLSGSEAPIKPGNAMKINSIPVGTTIHNVEMKPGKGGQLARSAGAAVQLVAREGRYATVLLRSGEMRRVHTRDDRPGIEHRAQSREARQGRREALAWRPAHRARCGHEPGRSPAWWW
jgi:large subunit ribosomal protein L2